MAFASPRIASARPAASLRNAAAAAFASSIAALNRSLASAVPPLLAAPALTGSAFSALPAAFAAPPLTGLDFFAPLLGAALAAGVFGFVLVSLVALLSAMIVLLNPCLRFVCVALAN
ncbi:MAG: hypothetical protein V2I27_07840 [Erythrobacter sp.]|nr:hypothetical protein [Erythrobacter sp.]